MIPKIIYYTWVSDKPLPDKFKIFIDGWKELMPDYEIRPITLENCPHNAWIDECLRQKKYVLAGHYARCQRLYETGGIYCDIDIEAVKSFDKLLHNDFFLGAEIYDVANNAIFGSVANHKVLRDAMDYMNTFDINQPEAELKTGPRMFTSIVKKYGWDGRDRNQIFNGIMLYQHEYFYPYLYTEQYTPSCITQNTYAIHHWAGTWTDKKKLEEDLVSIVIPCYKQANYLPDAINSALNQTYKNVEVIVVNDGSPDNTSEVARKYPVRLVEKPNGGLSSARNAGIKAAKGKWILTLDSDDKIDPTYIQKAIGLNDIVSCDLITFGDENQKWDSPNTFPTLDQEIMDNQIHCCSLYKKEIWDKIGGYDENMKLGYEDWDFWIRAMIAGYKIQVLREPLFFYRKHGISMVNGSRQNHKIIREYMLNKYKHNG